MDDKTRGDTPGTGPDFNAPLKRDRKRLRSAEPSPTPSPSARPAAKAAEPEELLEPTVSPVEQLFAVQSAAPVVTIPQVRSYDVDLTNEGRSAGTADAQPAVRRPATPVGEPTATAGRAMRNQVPTEPYVPSGGFTGPGHPKLGPLAPVPAESHPGLARLDVAAIVAAVLLPPIGLITAVIALIRGKQIRGWASDLARAAISVSVVMTVVFAAVGGYVWFTETEKAEQLAVIKAEQRAHDRVAAASAPFCEVLAAHPTIYATADPDYGWPAVDAPAGYNAAITEYAAIWAQLAEVAPEGIAAETAAISERVAGVVSVANALGSSNRAGDLLGFKAADDLATVESWYVKYCNPAETPAE